MAWKRMKRFKRMIGITNKRRGSKSNEDTYSEMSNDSICSRNQPKLSILGTTSFCCASGQKEDILDSKMAPRPPKKRPPASKKETEDKTQESPQRFPLRGLLARTKRGKLDSDGGEGKFETGSAKFSNDETKRHAPADKVHPADDFKKKMLPPPSPQRRLPKEPKPETHKTTDGSKKITIAYPSPSSMRKFNGAKVLDDFPSGYGVASKLNSAKVLENFHSGYGVSTRPNPERLLEKITNGCGTKLNGAKVRDNFPSEYIVGHKHNGLKVSDDFPSAFRKTSGAPIVEIMSKSLDGEELDCPCCDTIPTANSDNGLKMYTSCDVITATDQSAAFGISKDHLEKERELQLEVDNLREDLQLEKKKLLIQHDKALHLEELSIMQQLKQELEKEKELKKIAEDKLLELLDYKTNAERMKKEQTKSMESKSTQLDWLELSPEGCKSGISSPHLLGYEGRLKKYQTYITKLEKDNLVLLSELKKFKDLSPKSQEEHAKLLVGKLGEIERSSQQQQIQYETCLDEVANKLVQTLLVQKRLEEECKILHLRVEQLEHENKTLVKLLDKSEQIENEEQEKILSLDFSNFNSHNAFPPHSIITSSPMIEKQASSNVPESKQRNTPKSTIHSPSKILKVSPSNSTTTSSSSKQGCSSKIPSFGSSKPPPKSVPNKSLDSDSQNKDLALSQMPNPKLKLPISSSKSKATSSKRKRVSRNDSPAEKSPKDIKQRAKDSHMNWDRSPIIDEISQVSSKVFPQPQQVWSFNCQISNTASAIENKKKIERSIDIFSDKLESTLEPSINISSEFNIKNTSSASEAGTSMVDGAANKTRDEGYSTMSSDLQPDSSAENTISSEADRSETYVVPERDLNCPSDDSVTECLSSMTSSSDSGFGPLAANLPADSAGKDDRLRHGKHSHFDNSTRKHATVKSRDQIASVKPIARCPPVVSNNDKTSDSKPNADFSIGEHELKFFSDATLKCLDKSINSDTLKSSNYARRFAIEAWTDDWMFSRRKDVNNGRKSWHVGTSIDSCDDKIIFCNRNSYIDDNIFDDKVETAEKATLTEPEEELWREKALAPFIDESIWSLNSSEGDIQSRNFTVDPLLSEPSLKKFISSDSPCITVMRKEEMNLSQVPAIDHVIIRADNSYETDVDKICRQRREKYGLERVASDTVLYLKEAVNELEDSMHRGLKSSKNIPTLHQNSEEESSKKELVLKPEVSKTTEDTISKTDDLSWPFPNQSSSTSSLQSSSEVSDETENFEGIRTSRKNSQDPDSSSSDNEYENLEQKASVERWLQKEIAYNQQSKVSTSLLETVEESDEARSTIRRHNSLPCEDLNQSPIQPRSRFMSFSTTSNLPKPVVVAESPSDNISSSVSVISPESFQFDDPEGESLNPEATEFNQDFYKLCNVGSLRSLDQFSPAWVKDGHPRPILDSPIFGRKPLKVPTSSHEKPTVFVRPTRPASLEVNRTPNIPHHSLKRSLDKTRTISPLAIEPKNNQQQDTLSDSVHLRKCSGQKVNPSKVLPAAELWVSGGAKPKTPTKIVFKSSAKNEETSRRLQMKKDRAVSKQSRLKEGCGTAWVHLQPMDDFCDPKTRISLLDSIKAPSSSSGSSSDEDDDEILIIQTNSHLHRICKERRQRAKASANNPLYDLRKRSSVMNRPDLFYRFGNKEQEAMACFDFLEDIPSASIEKLNNHVASAVDEFHSVNRSKSFSERSSFMSPTIDSMSSKMASEIKQQSKMAEASLCLSPRKPRLPNVWNQPLCHNMSSSTISSHDYEVLDHISLSDSCAESYSSTPDSHDDAN